MQNRFGLKDFISLVMLLIVGVCVWLAMFQKDMHWEKMLTIDAKLKSLEQQMSRIESKIGEASIRPVPINPATSPDAAGASNHVAARDESWARPDVPIKWQKPWTPASDPREMQRYSEGGEFTEIFEGQPSKITPFLFGDVYGRRIADVVSESLGAFDPITLEFRGVLAEAWQYDPAGMWLRVKIRDEARFSDGRPVTAEDVRWTFHDFIFNPEIETDRQRSTLDNIKSVTVINDKTAEFAFGEAMFTNLTYTMGFYILPAHFYSQFSASQINQSTGLLLGSGPFKLAVLNPDRQWAPGTDVVLTRNEQYYAIKPALAGMRYRVVNDELARLTAYRNGEGDMILPSSPQFQLVTQEEGWDKDNYSLNWINMRSGYSFIAWQAGPRNGKLRPFHDQRVRMAMTHLLDRERMIRDIWEGIGEVATGSNNPQSPASNPDITPWPYDLNRAKALLAESGWIDRDDDGVLENEAGEEFEFEFTRPSGGEVAERISAYVKNQCVKAGIRCEVRIVDWSVYSDLLKTRDFDSIIMSWSASSPESDPKQIWHSDSILGQGDNFIQWSNPEADRLIDAIRTEIDDDRRMKHWHEFEAVLHREQPYTFIRVVPWLRFVKKQFGNVHTYKTGLQLEEFFRYSASVPMAATN